MAFYSLPTSLEVGGEALEIRTDYRAVLDICTALCDTELDNRDKAAVVLAIMYKHPENIDSADIKEALDKAMWFINVGEENKDEGKKKPKLMDWEQDFKFIAAPISKALGKDIRSVDYMHWWTFIGYYNEIGDCMFGQIVSIRSKLAKHEKLDKQDRAFYNANKSLVDFKTNYTDSETELLKLWTGGG